MVSVPARYLVFFQYFGTKYSGVMQTSTDQSVVGVQNYLEKAAQNLKPVVPIKFHISSRTDTGVHALCNSAHFDIQREPGKPPFSEKQLLYGLNYHLRAEPIRILNVCRVASSFHARFSALSRTYIYRLLMGCTHHSQIPVFERDLCWAPAGGSLNIPAMQDAAQFLLGTHDFSTFRSLNSETPLRSPVRTILQVDIRPSPGFLSHHYEHRYWLLLPRGKRQLDVLPVSKIIREIDKENKDSLFNKDVLFSFKVYEETGVLGVEVQRQIVSLPPGTVQCFIQVRRMVGSLVAVGQGKLTPQHIKELLEIKDPRAFPANAMAPPSGLFLKSVEYDEADLDPTVTPGE